MGKKKLTADEVQARLPAHLSLRPETYINTKQKALFVDSEYGEFWCRFNDIQNGHGHRARGYASPKRTKPPKAKAAPSDSVVAQLPAHLTLDTSTYTKKHCKARFIDSEYGEFWSLPADVLDGHGHPMRWRDKVKVTSEDVKARLVPHLSLDESTFVSIYEPAKFTDSEYGEFWIKPRHLIYRKGPGHPERGKRAKKDGMMSTCINKYGVPYPMQDADIALRSAEKSNKITKIPHWDGSGMCICKGSWEVAVVNHLNANKIPFKWQIPFRLSNGCIYICDLYLEKEDKYIEIKGYFREDAKKKWEEFVSIYPSAELWDRSRLKEMKLI